MVEIDLKDVLTGVEKSLRFERTDFCERCSGQGCEPGTQRRNCPTCGGYGQVERQTSMGFFVTRSVVECPRCNGRGWFAERPCQECQGSGRGRRACTSVVKIPAGIHDGQTRAAARRRRAQLCGHASAATCAASCASGRTSSSSATATM